MMVRGHRRLSATLGVVALLVGGCADGSSDGAATPDDPVQGSATPTDTVQPEPSESEPTPAAPDEEGPEEEPVQDGAAAGFLPPEAGTSWVYTYHDPQEGEVVKHDSIEEVEAGPDDSTVVTLRQRFEFSEQPLELVQDLVVADDGSVTVPAESTFQLTGGEAELVSGDDLVWLSAEQIEAGDSVTGQFTVEYEVPGMGQQAYAATYTSSGHGIEEVTVPAGTFDAHRLEIEYEPDDGGESFTTTLWLVESMGYVRQETSGFGAPVVVELVEFSSA